MRDESLDFLKRLLTTPSPSGYESAGQRVWCEYARQYADEELPKVTVQLPCFNEMFVIERVIDALCLFVEPEYGQPLRCLHRFPFPFPSPEPEERPHHDQQLLQQNLYPGYQCHLA